MGTVILNIIGTRPEAIKMAPVIRELARHPGAARSLVCVTGQHRDLIAPILDLFEIQPDYELSVMQPGQTLAQLTASLLEGLDCVLAEVRPDWLLAQGDTTTVLAAGLAAYYRRVRFGHVEAGLRTGDKFAPFPEELNRRMVDVCADALFAPTVQARANLLREGCAPERIFVTGNTVVDALREAAERPFDPARAGLPVLAPGRRLVLVTAHRRESFGPPLREMCEAIRELADRYRAGVEFLFPVHLNPDARRPVLAALGGLDNVSLIEPLGYRAMVHLMQRAELILTDSGGLQEEAPTLGVPVVVMRESTERPEGVAAGLARLAGTTRQGIVDAVRAVLETPPARGRLAETPNPYGDGHAAERIVAALLGAPTTPGLRGQAPAGAPRPLEPATPGRLEAGAPSCLERERGA